MVYYTSVSEYKRHLYSRTVLYKFETNILRVFNEITETGALKSFRASQYFWVFTHHQTYRVEQRKRMFFV